MMDRSKISSINHQIYLDHPEFKGVEPSIKHQGDNFILSYEKQVSLNTGKILYRNLRLVVNQAGNILKISTSR
jgi:hypothetical protein